MTFLINMTENIAQFFKDKEHPTALLIHSSDSMILHIKQKEHKIGDNIPNSNIPIPNNKDMSSHHVAAASSDSATIKKEEEEEEEEEEKVDLKSNHVFNVNKNNCDLNNRSVKKEEEEEGEETDSKHEDNDDCFEDWRAGNWCWVISSTATATNTSSSHNTSSINNEDTIPKKKKKARSLSLPHPPSDRNNTDIKRADDNEVDNKRNSDDGYESWTEGNWCLLLPTNKRRKQPPVRAKIRSSYTSSSQNSLCLDDDPDPDKSNELDKNNFNNDKDKDDNYDGRNTITYTKTHNEKWNEMFQRLTSYKKQHNSTSVPRKYAADVELAIWVNNQRARNEAMSEYRVNLLNSIGFVWSILENQWDKMFNRLVAYKKQHHGSTLVHKRYGADTQLGQWAIDQRKYYMKEKLSAERIERLESIDFVWDLLEEGWMAMYDRLVMYKKKHKSTQVPFLYNGDNQLPHLGHWVCNQRVYYRDGKLLRKREESLNSINFMFESGK